MVCYLKLGIALREFTSSEVDSRFNANRKHRRGTRISAIAHGPSSPFTRKLQREITRWSNPGKGMRRVSPSLYLGFVPIRQHTHGRLNRLVSSLQSLLVAVSVQENQTRVALPPSISRTPMRCAPRRPISPTHRCRCGLAKPFAFFPQKCVVWVNSVWFLSLGISLLCMMVATSLQQWAR